MKVPGKASGTDYIVIQKYSVSDMTKVELKEK